MKKITLFTLLILSAFVFSCKEESLITPVETFAGEYELQKIELIVDGNALILPFELSDKKFNFKSDGTFTYPEDLLFYEGKYEYSSKDKTITFSDDDPEYAYKSVLTVEKKDKNYTLKSKTEDLSLDIFGDSEMSYDQEIGMLTIFMLEEYIDDPTVSKFADKIGENPKKFSFNYYLTKK
ncbi:MAG: hypothetical protein LCH67_14925 [Bacteroidetes bacterium]|nr:hypothetical protein [Bacteroidota bacterium]